MCVYRQGTVFWSSSYTKRRPWLLKSRIFPLLQLWRQLWPVVFALSLSPPSQGKESFVLCKDVTRFFSVDGQQNCGHAGGPQRIVLSLSRGRGGLSYDVLLLPHAHDKAEFMVEKSLRWSKERERREKLKGGGERRFFLPRCTTTGSDGYWHTQSVAASGCVCGELCRERLLLLLLLFTCQKSGFFFQGGVCLASPLMPEAQLSSSSSSLRVAWLERSLSLSPKSISCVMGPFIRGFPQRRQQTCVRLFLGLLSLCQRKKESNFLRG